MTSRPSGEARDASIRTHGDSRPTDGLTEGSPHQVPLPADAPVANGALASSVESVTSKPTSASGDEDRPEAAERHSREPTEASSARQTSTSPQDPARDRPVQDPGVTQSLQTSLRDSLAEETRQMAGTPGGERESAPTTPRTKVQLRGSVDAQPIVSAADVDGELGSQATSTTETVEEGPEGPEALNADTEALPGAGSRRVTAGDLEDRSGDLQAQQLPPSPGGSTPPSPGPQEAALGRGSLDSRLYEANEENTYMRSMTSLLGGGGGSISSLADVLVWSETTVGMATALLASGHSSVTDLLYSTGPSLRSVSSILGSTFSSGLMAGTSSALRSVTHVLETVEQRTVEGVRSVMRFLTSHLLPGQAHAGPNSE
ncbi:testis-expressed protein 44 [Mirounga leonina]|uniref:testis-expressed protein 44 n=1 Tax=Mirounga leonina TaxID=9715 RepID=UPI00156C2C4A|nr:testis-expressed protein 44 [Mirounga leonina]KAF3824050.1 hypothetical protein GH733_008335 [Mirounga leonina]